MVNPHILAQQKALAEEFSAKMTAFNMQMSALLAAIAAGFVAVGTLSAVQAESMKQLAARYQALEEQPALPAVPVSGPEPSTPVQ
jgi:hypothetical protein